MRKIAHIFSRFGYVIGAYPFLIIGAALSLCFSILTVFIFDPPVIETDIRRGFAYRNSRPVLEFKVKIVQNYDLIIIINRFFYEIIF